MTTTELGQENAKLSSYQNPEGILKDRLVPRTDKRLSMIDPRWFYDKTILDLGCNNGYFVRLALKNKARRAVGVDKSDCILGARELAAEEGLKAEFWQADLDGQEFRRFCPKFDVVLLLSVITHLKDKENFLDWLDDKIRYMLIFESNHGEANKVHIELVKKHIYFESIEYLGPSDIPEKPHHLWVCRKPSHEKRYGVIASAPFEFVPIDKIKNWSEDTLMNQKTSYGLKDLKFLLLRDDIKKRGIRDPLVVEEIKSGEYKGFQGIHRYLAAKQLNYKDVPCKVFKGLKFKHLQ